MSVNNVPAHTLTQQRAICCLSLYERRLYPLRAETLLLLPPCCSKCTKTHQRVLMLPWQKIAAASSLSTFNILPANIWDLELICLYRPRPQWLPESWQLIIYQFLAEETQCTGIFELVLGWVFFVCMHHWLLSLMLNSRVTYDHSDVTDISNNINYSKC